MDTRESEAFRIDENGKMIYLADEVLKMMGETLYPGDSAEFLDGDPMNCCRNNLRVKRGNLN